MSRLLNYNLINNKIKKDNVVEKLALAAVASFKFSGNKSLKKLKKFFPSWSAVLKAKTTDLRLAGLEDNYITEFIKFQKNKEPEKIQEDIDKQQLQVITLDDDNYPAILQEIPSLPWVLFVKTNNWQFKFPALTVVGARKASHYGLQITKKLIEEINFPLTIISGLALGIDRAAHLAALNSQKNTMAILGSGLNPNIIYPPENRYLAQQIIAAGGQLISEFPPNMPPLKYNFPRRNRLLAAFSPATLVIEAGEKSGALITAHFALEFNREVLAVPGPIFNQHYIGSNRLIKEGAASILEATDILEILNLEDREKIEISNKYIPQNQPEALIINSLKKAESLNQVLTVDEITIKTGLDTSAVNSTLSILEIKKVVQSNDNGFFLN